MQTIEKTEIEKTEAEVLSVLSTLLEAYQNRDIDSLLSVTAPDDDLFLFGTGRDEKRIGRDEFRYQAERDWAQTEALAFNFSWHRVSTSGSVAWVASEGMGQGRVGGQEIAFPLRMTTVLVNQNNEWLIRQSHFSLPAPGQEDGNSVPL